MINRVAEHHRCFGLALRKYGIVVLMGAMLVLGAGSMTTIAKAAEARDTVKKGTLEIGVLSGYWKENDLDGTEPSSDQRAIYVLPQFGMVLTDEFKAGWLSGNVELCFWGLASSEIQFPLVWAVDAILGWGRRDALDRLGPPHS
jgi:hypothetical protein